MKSMFRWLLTIAVSLSALAACAGVPPEQAVHVRVRNEGPLAWENMWLGAGGPAGHIEHYGDPRAGETTRYHALEPMLAKYRKTDILVVRGRRYENVVYPEQHVGTPTLAPGHYTFAYRIVDDALQMTISRDPAPRDE